MNDSRTPSDKGTICTNHRSTEKATVMADPDSQIDFCTLGMFIIDEIHPSPSSRSQIIQRDIIGGAGTYSAVGARLFSPAPLHSSRVCWIIDTGSDFPSDIHNLIKSWSTHAIFRPRPPGELTTRGWNGYSGNEVRAFKYLTPKKRLTAEDVPASIRKNVKSWHLICGPERCDDQVKGILQREGDSQQSLKAGDGNAERRPLIIWEPVPDLCIPSELPATLSALNHVDVISPNHEELGSLFGYSHPSSGVDTSAVEAQAASLLSSGIGTTGDGAVVVRCGVRGCYVLTKAISKWLPAVHEKKDSQKVKDPTGGGNGFLGGLAVGLVRGGGLKQIVEAARWGSVSASFCIEQVGVPVLSHGSKGEEGEKEMWNGESVFERLEAYRKREELGV